MDQQIWARLFDRNGRFISTPANWASLTEAYENTSDAELRRLGSSKNGSYFFDEYVAGSYPVWNGEFRKPGDIYEGLAHQIVILFKRQESRRAAENYNQIAVDALARN